MLKLKSSKKLELLFLKYIRYMKLVREHINEKFIKDSDPIKDMGIGIESKIENEFNKIRKYLMSKYFIQYIKISINGDKIIIKLSTVNHYTRESEKMIQAFLMKNFNNSILNDCLIYSKKIQHMYIIRIKPEYQHIFKNISIR